MNIMDFIKPELIILVVVLYFIGIAIKKSEAKDKWIPFILGACGIVLAVVWVLATTTIATYQDALMAVFVAVTQGIIVAGMSVYANQLFKQFGKDE